VSKWNGTTADEMNYKARQGLVSQSDLEEWATTQNKFVVSIEWYVDYHTRPMPTIVDPNGYMKIYQLRSRNL